MKLQEKIASFKQMASKEFEELGDMLAKELSEHILGGDFEVLEWTDYSSTIECAGAKILIYQKGKEMEIRGMRETINCGGLSFFEKHLKVKNSKKCLEKIEKKWAKKELAEKEREIENMKKQLKK